MGVQVSDFNIQKAESRRVKSKQQQQQQNRLGYILRPFLKNQTKTENQKRVI